jgi:hypothetical protein
MEGNVVSVMPADGRGYNPDEPRDERGRWTSSGLLMPNDNGGWSTRPLRASVKERAGLLANHTYLSLPPRLRRDWGWDNSTTTDALSRLLPVWSRAEPLSDADFRERYLRGGTSLETTQHLRAAAVGAVHALTLGTMADAADELAAAIKTIGSHDWPRFLAVAESRTAAAPPLEVEQHPFAEHDEDDVILPPGDRNDELGSLLEWVANARPGEEQAIRQEIKRVYYDFGDKTGGDALNGALSQALEPGMRRQDREKILEDYEHYTHGDPADVGAMRNIIVNVAQLSAARSRVYTPPSGPAAIGLAERARIWALGWAARGQRIEEIFGKTLQGAFKTIDSFINGIAISIKTIDLRSATYQSEKRLLRLLTRYINKLAEFKGAELDVDKVKENEITGRLLHIIVPKGELTAEQRSAFRIATERAKKLGVDIRLTPF